MGKKMIRASIWTCRSLLSLYSKAVALIFAVFCVVSGMSAGTVSTKEGKSGKTISGKALLLPKLTTLKKAKIYLGNQISCPVYGSGCPCEIYAVDSTVTDSLGNFKIGYPETLFKTGQGTLYFVQAEPRVNKRNELITTTELYSLNANSDTTITLHLKPIKCTSILTENSAALNPLLNTSHGNTVSIKIGNWSAQKKYSARIVDVTGKLVVSPLISPDGSLSWNTEKHSRGVYFINVETDHGSLNTKIAVK